MPSNATCCSYDLTIFKHLSSLIGEGEGALLTSHQELSGWRLWLQRWRRAPQRRRQLVISGLDIAEAQEHVLVRIGRQPASIRQATPLPVLL